MEMLEEGQLDNLRNLIYEMDEKFNDLNVSEFRFFAIDSDNPELIQVDKRIVFKDPNFVYSDIIEYHY